MVVGSESFSIFITKKKLLPPSQNKCPWNSGNKLQMRSVMWCTLGFRYTMCCLMCQHHTITWWTRKIKCRR
jgi:hypothetical protein